MNKSQQRTNCLLTPVHGLSCYDPLINDLNAHRVCSAYGIDDSQRAHFLSALARDTGRGMIILVPNDQAAMRMREDMDVLTGGRARMLPPRDISFVRSAASSRDLAMRDDLTKAYNRRFFETYLDEEIERSRRYGTLFSIIFLDLDDLKMVNNFYGHLSGSRTLQEVAKRILGAVRGMTAVRSGACGLCASNGGSSFQGRRCGGWRTWARRTWAATTWTWWPGAARRRPSPVPSSPRCASSARCIRGCR